MKLSCKVIEDLLPLYHDGVCSPESAELVEEHLAGCEKCQAVLEDYDYQVGETAPVEDTAPLRAIRARLRRETVIRVFWAILICAVVAGAAVLLIYTRPRPLINPSGPYLIEPEIYHVELGGEIITDQVDLEKLMEPLRDAIYRKSVFPGWDSYQLSDDMIEMTVRTGYQYEVVSVIVTPRGQYVCDFSTKGSWWHEISDGEAVYDALWAVIEGAE